MEAAPEIISQQSADIQIIVWLGGIMIVGLLWAIRIIWVKYNEQSEYIRSQDKSNILLLTELLNVAKVSGVDVTKVYDAIVITLNPKIVNIENTVININNKLEKK